MMYAKVKDNEIAQFPYGVAELQADNPYTHYDAIEDVAVVFPETEQATKLGFTLVPVTYAATPAFDPQTQMVEYPNKPELVGGEWVVPAVVADKPAAQVTQELEYAWARLRASRNAKLTACDWTQLADAPVDSLVWAVYRQELRDLPGSTIDPFNPVWPIAP